MAQRNGEAWATIAQAESMRSPTFDAFSSFVIEESSQQSRRTDI